MRAARYLGVPPWELSKQPLFWMNAALTSQYVENEYQRQVNERNKQQ